MKCLNELTCSGGAYVLTRDQQALALEFARVELLSDPVISERLRDLQCKAVVRVSEMVKERHGLPADAKFNLHI